MGNDLDCFSHLFSPCFFTAYLYRMECFSLSFQIYQKKPLIKVNKQTKKGIGPYDAIETIFYYFKGKKYYLKIYHSTWFKRHWFSRLGCNAVIVMVMVDNNSFSYLRKYFLSYLLSGGSWISLPEWIKMQHKHGLCVWLCIRIT